jgi:hypothetical protein
MFKNSNFHIMNWSKSKIYNYNVINKQHTYNM